ncbi:hypothetical protein JCM16814_26770 [Desulfobaculum senezii]
MRTTCLRRALWQRRTLRTILHHSAERRRALSMNPRRRVQPLSIRSAACRGSSLTPCVHLAAWRHRAIHYRRIPHAAWSIHDALRRSGSHRSHTPAAILRTWSPSRHLTFPHMTLLSSSFWKT